MNERPDYLAALASADRNADTPKRVEAALRARAAAKRRQRWVPVWIAAAAGACAALLFTVRLSHVETLLVAPLDVPAPPLMAYERSKPQPAATPVAPPVVVSKPRQERRNEVFYALASTPPEMLAGSQLVRVSVPRAALLSFGLPVNAYRNTADKIDADVIFTEDGIARAIRFVN